MIVSFLKKAFALARRFGVAWSGVFRQLGLIVLALVLAAVVLLVTGYDPVAVYSGLLIGALADMSGTLRWATPLAIAGLAAAISFRASVYNLGIDGQLYLGAITAAIIGLQFGDIPFPLSLVIAVFGGMVAGGLWAALPGFLRAQWGASEVVTTILLNFVAFLITDYLVLGPFHGTGAAAGTYSTNNVPESFWLARILPGSQVNLGLIFAILIALFLTWFLSRTTVGYEFKIAGRNPLFARYGGMNVRWIIVLSMTISGAIAGLVGVVEVLGVHHRFPGRFSTGLGFDGIVVALLAANNPIGVLFAGLFFGALRNGAMNMERVTSVPRAMVDIVEAIVVLMVTMQLGWGWLRLRRRQAPEPESSTIAPTRTGRGS